MPKYEVFTKRTLSWRVVVEAANEDEAMGLSEQFVEDWQKSKYIKESEKISDIFESSQPKIAIKRWQVVMPVVGANGIYKNKIVFAGDSKSDAVDWLAIHLEGYWQDREKNNSFYIRQAN